MKYVILIIEAEFAVEEQSLQQNCVFPNNFATPPPPQHWAAIDREQDANKFIGIDFQDMR